MDQVFLAINSWMSQGMLLGALGCFLWGMVSVLFSPCHLASIPLLVGYVAGQDQAVEGRRAAVYAVLFTLGLFVTIAAIGVVCTLLGRMLGDVGPYMNLVVGAVLIWVALDILGVASCSLPGGLLARIRVKGAAGALVLGLAYGILSGSCTFGFIAPILAIITVQEQILTGLVFIVLFGLGHCRGRQFHRPGAALPGQQHLAAGQPLLPQAGRGGHRRPGRLFHDAAAAKSSLTTAGGAPVLGRADVGRLSGCFRVSGGESSGQGKDERPDLVAHRAVGLEDHRLIRGLFRQAGRVGKSPVDDAPGKIRAALVGMVTEGDHPVEGD
jgi:cytochrome c-type biogenesis protein